MEPPCLANHHEDVRDPFARLCYLEQSVSIVIVTVVFRWVSVIVRACACLLNILMEIKY